tara:strand:- start:781 stop:1047 length:267 start_codon:yes stop_codon:yes gene_type:complete
MGINITSKTDNELIAEFMNLRSTGLSIYKESDYKYHKSWDWLMPVVKKCFCTGDNTFEWDAIMDAMWTCDIKIVHNVVVEFINQHNKI